MNVRKLCLITLLSFPLNSIANSCPEITRSSHPMGLKHTAINCYTDNYWLANNTYPDQREQNFLRVENLTKNEWGDSTVISSESDKVRLFLYATNNGENDKYPANNVKIKVDWSIPSAIKASIIADNTFPKKIEDTASIHLKNGLKLKPRYIYYKDTLIKKIMPNETSVEVKNETMISRYEESAWFFVTFDIIR